MKTKYFLLVLFFTSSSLFCQSQVENLLGLGLNQAYNLELSAAQKTFTNVIKLKPNSPAGYYNIAKIKFWKYLGSKKQEEFNSFIKYADEAQQRIDAVLNKNPKDYKTMCMAGNLTSYRAMAQATNNSSVDAFWSSKKAVSYFEDALELNPKYYDAYMGLGLFDYAMSFVPDFLKWAVNLTGLSSDKERGFRYIKLAYKKGTGDKVEAAFHLSKIYSDYLADYDSAYICIKPLIEKYPNNILFNYQYAVTLIKDRQLDKALDVLNKVIKSNNKNLPLTTALAIFRRGQINFKKNRFSSAIKQYKAFLDTTSEMDYKGVTALNTALCYKFLGDEANSKKYLMLAKNGNQDVFEDSYARQRSERYLSGGIPLIDLKLVKMKNFLDAGQYKIVYDSLRLALDKFEKLDDKAIALAYFGEASLYLKKYPEADYAANQILSLKLPDERWTIPTAYFVKAKIKFLKGDKAEAKELLENAADNNNHEFKDNIQAQIEWLKRRLGRK